MWSRNSWGGGAVAVTAEPAGTQRTCSTSALDVNLHQPLGLKTETVNSLGSVGGWVGGGREGGGRRRRRRSLAGTLITQFQKGSRPVFGVTAVIGQCASVMADAAQWAFPEASAAGLRTHRPLSQKPGGTRLGRAGP